MTHRTRASCRLCGGNRLRMFLRLGPTPLANSFLRSPAEFAAEAAYPLDLHFCEGCSLVQLIDVIDPEVLFRHYLYVTGTSDTIAAHNVDYARAVTEQLSLGASDLVVEVASNDGSLLRCFQRHGVRTLGVEPAANIAAMARAAGVPTVERFFGAAVARELRAGHGGAKAVIGNNVLAHVDDPRDFILGCAELLEPGGRVVIEVPALHELIDRLEYDTVYHEHLSYFSATTLLRLAESAGLSVARLDLVPVHGGSFRMYAGRAGAIGPHADGARAFAEEEARRGLTAMARFERFAVDVAGNRSALLELLRGLAGAGKRIAGYGAPAKGNTLLNYCGIGPDLVEYTVDKNPLKVGLYTPGMRIPVLPVSTLLERQPDYVLILAWNFADEIIRQQTAYRERGGRFIVPIPVPRIV